MNALTRRQILRAALAGAGAAALGGCGAGGGPAATGSTLVSRWGDPVGDGQLRTIAGERLLDRLDLGARSPAVAELARLAHVTDAHVLDAASPARVSFLDRLGSPFQSTFRPQEALTAQVLAGMVAAVRAARPQLVIQGGDLIDNDQSNELAQALAVLRGGVVRPAGAREYVGVQSSADPDPFYYRPGVDAPLHPDLLRAASRPFLADGLGRPWSPVLGDHDALVAGEIVPTALTRSLAVGDRALWDLPRGLTLPAGAARNAQVSPDGPPDPVLVDEFLRRALEGPTVAVPADSARREMAFAEVVSRLGGHGPRLDYRLDVALGLRLLVLDLVRRGGGSGGLVDPAQPAWLERELTDAGERWVIVVSHQPIESSEGGAALLALLDRSPRVIALLSGHTHRNRITPRPTVAGGYWQISTASLIDYPQQARALRLLATADGGVAIETWMLDHVRPGGLGRTARQLSFLDAQGGRPARFIGTHSDRNVRLYRARSAR